ncbi:MAG: hypothetical protein AAFV53_14780 [Myxococcota bacterium]
MSIGGLFGLVAFLSAGMAQQKNVNIDRGSSEWSFDVRWADQQGDAHRARFSLPAAQVTADLEVPLRFKKRDAAQHAVDAVRAYGETQRGVQVRASAGRQGRINISVSGKNRQKMKRTLKEATQVRDRALEAYREEHGFTLLRRKIIPDHARHASEYAASVAPLVDALGGPTDDPREFAQTALGYVQSIPYEKLVRLRDRYRRPLSVLGRNRGDCDSKSTLFLALMRQAYPDLPLAMVYIPEHAYVGLGISPQRGDAKLKKGDDVYVLAEPVGPSMMPIGEAGKKSRRAARRGKAKIRRVKTHP